MVRKALRTAFRRAWTWLMKEPNEPVDDAPDLYRSLFPVYREILAEKGGAQRPDYAWAVLHSASLARQIGIRRVSALEFGVAGGKGLIALERIAQKVGNICGVGIDVYGFDTGTGLPKPQDYRDLPNLWSEGYFPMDKEKLQKRLKNAHLILGLIEDTIENFLNSKPSPVAFLAFDLDLYSSTMHAFRLLDAAQDLLLPRIHCYFDDIMVFTYGDHNGPRLAISEFNNSHPMRKISPIYGLKHYMPREVASQMWVEKFYMAHICDHELYSHNDGLIKQRTLDINDE